MKKIQYTSGRIEVYPDRIHLVQIGLFFRTKTTPIPFSDITGVSAPFDVLKIETNRNGKYRLRFWNDQAAFIARNAIKAAMKDAGF
jgi:hypothetical protein